MSKLTVVFLADTGHVLAALTRADPPTAAEPVSALVGAGLPIGPVVGGTSAAVTVPAAKLEAVTVDDQPAVPLDPWSFQVVKDPQRLKPPSVASIGVPGSGVTLAISTAGGAVVTVPSVASALSLPAVVVLQQVTPPGAAPLIVVTPVTVGATTVVVPPNGLVLRVNDTWDMYAFVPTLRPAARTVVVT